jgi:hypothetical protein
VVVVAAVHLTTLAVLLVQVVAVQVRQQTILVLLAQRTLVAVVAVVRVKVIRLAVSVVRVL